jgi:hypothetical protein
MMTLTLHVRGPDGSSGTHAFSEFPVRIGRLRSAELVMGFAFVSRHHARLELRDGRLQLCDEGSRHGTWVRDATERLPKGQLVDLGELDNEFRIGAYCLRAELREVADEATVQESERQAVAEGGARSASDRTDSLALALLRELSASNVPFAPALTSSEAVVAFVDRLDAVLDVLLEGVVALRFGYLCETNRCPESEPRIADLAAELFDWTNDGRAVQRMREQLEEMVRHRGARALSQQLPKAICSRPTRARRNALT